jgi:outer membrane protein OmpA-like peptidoglycan-associated protein
MYARMMIAAGVAALVSAAPAPAQQRGTIEFGAFASSTSYDAGLGMDNNMGFGGRVGAFFSPRFSVEFEAGGGTAGRTLGRADVNVGVLSGRLLVVPVRLASNRVSILLGGGVDHTDANFFESYGYHGLLGAKLHLSDMIALRVDGIKSWMATDDGSNTSLHFGLSVYRRPGVKMTTVYRTADAVPSPAHSDSVSASETARLRLIAINYQSLRDSLGQPIYPAYLAPSSAAALATMERMILFERSSFELSPEAKEILDAKVPIFRENPEMRIVITGFASQPGDSAYNMALGLRRAESTKAYLVSRGVAPVRIEIGTKGEGQLLVAGPEETAEFASANVANQRNQFRLLVADPYLIAPNSKSSHN